MIELYVFNNDLIGPLLLFYGIVDNIAVVIFEDGTVAYISKDLTMDVKL